MGEGWCEGWCEGVLRGVGVRVVLGGGVSVGVRGGLMT